MRGYDEMIKKDEVNNLKMKAMKDLKMRAMKDLEMILDKYNVKDVLKLNIEDLNEYDRELFEVASKVMILCYNYESLNRRGSQ